MYLQTPLYVKKTLTQQEMQPIRCRSYAPQTSNHVALLTRGSIKVQCNFVNEQMKELKQI